MIEQRPVHVQMIVTRHVRIDKDLVQRLTTVFAEKGVSGCVLLLPRKSSQERYRAVAHAEIVVAAKALGIETVWGLVGPWPADLKAVLPDLGDLSCSASEVGSGVLEGVGDPDQLPPLDKARFYAAVLERHGSHRKAAHALNIPRSRINNAVQLLKLDGQVQQALQDNHICESAARTLSLVTDHAQQRQLLDWYLRALPRPTIRELEASLRTLAAQEGDPTVNGRLVQRYCNEFTEQVGIRLRYASTGVGGWCSLDVADDAQGALLFGRLLQVASSDRCRVSARKTGSLLRIRFHVDSPRHLEQVLSAVQRVVRPQVAGAAGPCDANYMNNRDFYTARPLSR